jgi:hypothetical protein
MMSLLIVASDRRAMRAQERLGGCGAT